MEGYTIKIVGKTEEEILQIEALRKQVFHIKASAPNRYAKQIRDEKIIPFALFKGEDLIGGCYVGEGFDSLYIYYLFVREDFQKTGLRLGRGLLQEVLDHKAEIEALFDNHFERSALHPISEEVKKIYQKIGYQEAPRGLMIRTI